MKYLKISGWRSHHAHEDRRDPWHEEYSWPAIYWIDVHGIDEICDLGIPARKDDGQFIVDNSVVRLVDGVALKMSAGGLHSYVTYGTAAEWLPKIEKQILEDRRTPAAPAAPAAPTRLGYAYAANNLQFIAVAVDDIDDYATIEFRGRAARTAGEALAVAEPFSLKYRVSDVPINARPASAPRLVVPIPGADNINVGRSADGQTLYLLGQDGAAVFGLAVLGHDEDPT